MALHIKKKSPPRLIHLLSSWPPPLPLTRDRSEAHSTITQFDGEGFHSKISLPRKTSLITLQYVIIRYNIRFITIHLKMKILQFGSI